MPEFQAYVDNIGNVGRFPSKRQAVAAVRETIKGSARADKHGFVLDEAGEIVFEVGRQSDD